jgi:acyl-CoA synthetase (AMP-forming)/AMP-acid ligase II
VPLGEVGEVLVQGDSVMAGYWNNPEATAAAMRDGWLFTGDMGCLDADGFLTLKDRSKDLIISGGSNIYPREVEEVLLTAPGVAEVAGAPTDAEVGRWWPSSPRRRCDQRRTLDRTAWRRWRASSGPSATVWCRRCPRTTTARCSRRNCASSG